jgi:methionine-rich copper-binding protein CopC
VKCVRLLSIATLVFVVAACGERTPPRIVDFTASPDSLPVGGGNITLTWAVVGATSLTIDGGVGSVTGSSIVVNVTSSKTFTLTAANVNGTATAQAAVMVVTVNDTTLPAVTAVNPPNGTTGVKADTAIVITFSEPMKQRETEEAFNSANAGLRPSDVSFAWNQDGTVLTVTPDAPLNYATGTDPTTEALTYSFTFSDGAVDLAGNKLNPVSFGFKTLRRITATVTGDPEQDGSVDGKTVHNGSIDFTLTTSSQGFFGFNLSELPADLQATDITAAILRVNAQFPAVFGAEVVELEHVLYGMTLTAPAATTSALHDLGSLQQDPPIEEGWKSASVLTALQDDWVNRTSRGGRSQYRLRCTGCTVIFYAAEAMDSGGNAQLKTPKLVLEYLVP